ncbi:MAG: NAD+ synthase [Desulfobulbaceae bacterium]|nr:NAD+ synthase [Desulfobulbaceae bacterium]
MKLALVQINPVIGDFTQNIKRITECLDAARRNGCDLAVFPELAVSGYPPQDYLEHEAFLKRQDEALLSLKKESSGIGLLCGAITRHTGATGKPLHNSALLFENGKLIFSTHKRLLPTYDVFDESRYFEASSSNLVCAYKGLNLGITICEDIFNDEDSFPHPLYQANPVADLKQAGMDLLINIAASPYNMGKQQIRLSIFSDLCRKYQTPLLYINQVGGQDSVLFDGASLVLDKNGALCMQARSFQEDMLIVDTEKLRPDATIKENNETALVHQALAMGCRDYIKKCGFSKVLLGLSGGIDSALTCAIACEALGPENVMGVALPSPYTSNESIEDAGSLAQNLGIRFEIMPISDTFASFRTSLSPLFTGLAEDVTEQNIQARIRGTLLMAMANKFNALLLSTGNKSEMAVGYCTLYGDMCGALSVLSDVPKQLVYDLSRYVNRHVEIIPVRTIEKPPSAELAPDQKDQDDLPPYEVLDPILQAYLEEHLAIDAIVDMGFDRNIVEDTVRRIKRNEYKRQQAAMGLKVTSKAFGFGRRYPIAQRFME